MFFVFNSTGSELVPEYRPFFKNGRLPVTNSVICSHLTLETFRLACTSAYSARGSPASKPALVDSVVQGAAVAVGVKTVLSIIILIWCFPSPPGGESRGGEAFKGQTALLAALREGYSVEKKLPAIPSNALRQQQSAESSQIDFRLCFCALIFPPDVHEISRVEAKCVALCQPRGR